MQITYDDNGKPLYDGISPEEWEQQNLNTQENNPSDNIGDDTEIEEPKTNTETLTKEEQMKKDHPIKEGARQAGRAFSRFILPEKVENWFLGSKEDEALLNIYNNANLKTYDELREAYNNGEIDQQELVDLANLRADFDRISADDAYRQERNKNLGKGAVDVGSGFIPVGGLGKVGLKGVGFLKKFLSEKVALALTHGVKSGAITGAAMGAGEGLIDKDMNPVTSALEYGAWGAVIGVPFGAVTGKIAYTKVGKALGFDKMIAKLAQAEKAQTGKLAMASKAESEAIVKDIAVIQAKQDELIKSQTLIENVQTLIAEAEKNKVSDIEKFIYESPIVSNENKALVKEMFEHIQAGREVIAKEDGTFSIKVNKWQDAAYVSMDELKAQTNNDGISLSNQAIKDVWVERGWLAQGEELVNEKTGKLIVNTKAVNRIKDQYRNKFQIDNKIDIEFVDGQINGADGTTQTLEYTGKVVKNKQNSIDKKKLQIKELEDKITMLEGGNKEVSDPLNVLQEKLKIAKNELKDLEKPTKIGNIKILINKNASDIYATLRAELEHARDIAKGTVPKEANKHFSRYNGQNESEIYNEYVKHKADNRRVKAELDEFFSDVEETQKAITPEEAKYTTETNLREVNKNYNFEDKVQTIDGENYDSIIVTNKSGEKVADVTYTLIGDEDVFVNMFTRYSQTKGEGRTAIVALMQKYPDKTIFWEAINEESLKSYKKFVKEYPELAKRIDFQDRTKISKADTAKDFYDTFDNNKEPSYNTTDKGVINEGNNKSNTGTIQRNIQQQGMGIDKKQASKNQQRVDEGKPKTMDSSSSMGENKSSHTTINERGKVTSNIDNRPISERQQSLKSIEEANQLLEEDIKVNGKPDVRDWKTNLNNAEEIYARFYERGVDNLAGIKEAIAKGDVEYVNMVVEKQLAAERRMSDLKQIFQNLPENEYKKRDDIINSIFQLQAVSKELCSAYARGLNAQKLVKRVNNIFQLSTMQEMGIDKMADLLSVDIKNLNFTRGTESAKQQLYTALSNDKRYGKLLQDIFKEADSKAAFDDLLDNILARRITDTEELKAALRNFADPYVRRDIVQMLNYCTDEKLIGKVVANAKANRTIGNHIGDYVVNNLLSNPTTTIFNVASGVLNTGYFPFIKMLGGRLGGGSTLSREGYHQLISLYHTTKDAWKLGLQAFKTGEGKMINLSREIPSELDADKYKAFFNLQPKSFKEAMHNLYTLNSRAMFASDEFLTQLNYRAIVRAKAMEQAEQIAQVCGKTKDTEFIKQQIDKFFRQAFDTTGKPLDVNAYAEARDVVYQTPLSGKIYDFKTKSYTQIKEQSTMMKVGEGVTQLCMRVPILKTIFPFLRTPVNIGQMALEHNGLYNLLSPSQRKIILSKTEEGAKARAKVAFGLLSEALAWNLAASGHITGSPPRDAKERAALYKTGWQPYSFKVGNKYYSYARLEPLCTILGFAADTNYIATSYDNNADIADNLTNLSLESIQAILESTFNKAAFTNGINQFDTIINFVEGTDEIKEEQILKELNKFLPLNSLIQSASTLGQTEATMPYGYQAIYNKYGNRGLGDYKRNVFGERQDVYNYALVTAKQGLKEELPEDREMMRLAELGYSPANITNYESASTVKYKEFRNAETGRSLYDAMNEEMTQIKINNKTLREAVRQLISSDYYKAANDGVTPEWKGQKGTKVFMLNKVFNAYKKSAKAKTIKEQGKNFVNKDGLNAYEQREKDIQDRKASQLNRSVQDTLQNIRSFG